MADSPFGLFIGLTTIDIQYSVPSYPQPNTKNRAKDHRFAIGGPATNAAITFRHLGVSAEVFTVIGDHPMSDYMKSEFQRFRIAPHDLSPGHKHLPTIAAIISSEDNGDRTIFTNQRIPPTLSLAQLHSMLDRKPEIILVDGFYMEAAITAATFGKENGITTVLDGGSWKEGMNRLLPQIDIAICSEDFQVPGYQGKVFEFLSSVGVRQIAITRGEKPVLYQSDRRIGEVPVQNIQNARDTLAAGDIFHGAFCYYYLQSRDFIDSLQAASVIAGKSCQYLGAHEWME